MSPCRKVALPRTVSMLPGMGGHDRLSTFNLTSASISRRTRLNPMKPSPPVTRTTFPAYALRDMRPKLNTAAPRTTKPGSGQAIAGGGVVDVVTAQAAARGAGTAHVARPHRVEGN